MVLLGETGLDADKLVLASLPPVVVWAKFLKKQILIRCKTFSETAEPKVITFKTLIKL